MSALKSALLLLLAAIVAFVAYWNQPYSGNPVPPTTFGTHPVLANEAAAPKHAVLNFPTSVGWASGASPSAPAGFSVTRFAEQLEHGRWVFVLPNGDVLVSEARTVAPPNAKLEALVAMHYLGKANNSGWSANRITLLRDADGDGKVELRTVFLVGLDQPLGMALLDGHLYVGNTDSVVRYKCEKCARLCVCVFVV